MLCTHYPAYNSTDPDLWNCKPGNGFIALHVYLYYRVLYTSLCNQPINIHWSFLPFPPHSTHRLLVDSRVPITVKHDQPRSAYSKKTKKKPEKNVKKVKKVRKKNNVKKFKKGKKKKDSCNFCLYS